VILIHYTYVAIYSMQYEISLAYVQYRCTQWSTVINKCTVKLLSAVNGNIHYLNYVMNFYASHVPTQLADNGYYSHTVRLITEFNIETMI